MTNPANSDVQNLLPVQAYFSVTGEFQTFIGQGKPFYATIAPDQSGLHITNSTIDSSVIGGITPAAGTFTSIAATTGTVSSLPLSGNDMANKLYVDSVAAGLSWKQPVAVATLTDITLSGLQLIDGYTTLNGDRVMVKDQTNQAQNGIYIASSSAWTRAEDANTWAELVSAIAFIEYGGQKGSAWFSTAQPGGTLGVTPIVFSQFTTSATYLAGTGLTLTGFTFSITNIGTAGTYGSASQVPVFVTNAQGQVTSVTNTSIAIAATQITSGTLDSARLSGSYTGITGVGTLTAGTWQANPIAVLYGGTGATTAANARTNLGAAASGANSDITSMSGITGSIATVNTVGFNTSYSTALTAGQLGWDGNNTLAIGMAGGNVTQHIGEDQYFYYKASSAVTKGQVIMFTGAVGASGVPTGAPATGITDGSYIMGVAAESVSTNGFGLVQAFGTLRNVDTSGYADGDILWYNPAVTGGLTKTKPSAPNVKVQMAAVINGGSSGGGTILIRINPGSVLGGTDSNVQFGTLSNGDLIQYNGTYWANVAASSIAAGSVANSVTFNSSGGAAAGTSFNGSVARTVDYSTVGAPSASGAGASGTWGISITGNAGTATSATTATNLAGGATGSLPYQSAAGATTFLAAGVDGKVLTLASGVPTWASLPATGVTISDDTTTNATRYLTFTSATTGNITTEYVASTKLQFNPSTGAFTATTLTPTNALGATYGGTAQTSWTTGDLLYASGSNTLSKLAIGTTGQVLTIAGGVPSWGAAPGATVATTSTNATYYPIFNSSTSGSLSTANVNTSYTFNPSTGNLTAPQMIAGSGFYLNPTTIAANYTSPANYNLMSTGPITINTGVTVTIDTTANWVIL